VEFANESSQFQCKFWEKHDITVQPVITYIYLCVWWYAASLWYFFKPSNWSIRQARENLYTIGILSYTVCWCLLPFSNIYPATVHIKCICFGYRIKRECNISLTMLRQQGTQQESSATMHAVMIRRSCNSSTWQSEWGFVPRTVELHRTASVSWKGNERPLLH
jgi:hypothetical protein